MRRLNSIFLFLFFLLANSGFGQISVSVTGNTNTTPNLAASYTSLSAALTDLNSVTAMSGAVVLTCTGGTSETAPATGLTLGSASLNPVLSATNSITINTDGGVVTLNAGVGTATPTSAAPDGILKLSGADHVTINGLTFTDGNTTNPATMEYGLAFFKRAAGDGCNNNLIRNCTFNMQRVNNASGTAPMVEGSVGILVINSTATAATTGLTPTNGGTLATNGTNSGNRFWNNTINGGNYGIAINGFAATSGVGPAPVATTFLGDLNNEVGSVQGNTILNFGGGGSTNPSAGIRVNNQWGVTISNNTINNNNGSGVNHTTTLRGIFAQAGTSANATINNNTVTVNSGATTSVCSAIENSIGTTAAANTININNNTVQNCTYATATTGTLNGILTTSSAATVNTNNNTVNNNSMGTVGTASSCTFQGIYNSGASTNYIANNNTISNNTILNQGGTLFCLRGGTSLLTWNDNNVNNNSFTNNGGTLSASVHGLYDFSSPTQENFSGNQINNLTISGNSTSAASQINGIAVNTSASSNKAINNNTVHTLTFTNSSTGSCTINGITQSLGTTINISKNKIYALSAQGALSIVNGINLSSGTTFNVTNNLIGDLQTPTATGLIAIRGINVPGGTTANLYYNTVRLNAISSSVTTFGTSCIQFTTTTTLNLRNNILVNLSTPAQEGLNVATNGVAACLMRTSGTTGTVPANYATTSNNNAFWCNPAAGTNNHLTYVEGTATITNPQNTVANMRTFMVNRDQASVQENVNFQSTTGSSGDFLKFNTMIASQLEAGGATISGFSDDYLGTTRCPGVGCPGGASTPDMGAWELNGTPLDLVGPAISYSVFENTSCLTDRSLSQVTVSDGSGVNITPGTRPRLYFKKLTNANTYVDNTNATDGWKFVEATGTGGSPFSFTTNYSLLFGGAPVVGDAIQYFVVAQDLAGTPNVGINNGTFTATPANVALTAGAFPLGGTINQYNVVTAGLSGTVTIGASGTYPSLSGAGGLFSAINTSGLSGSLTVNIVDPSVTETGVNALNAVNYNGCATGPYPITIKPNTTSVITGSVSSGAIIKLNGADNVTIDGSNSGGSDRSLTIQNTTTATSGNAVIWLASPALGNGSNNNTIKNCIIEGNSATTTLTGVHIGGNATIGLTTAGNEMNNNNTINNNLFRRSQYGVTLFGYVATIPDLNNAITNNNFGTPAVGEGFSLLGINADRQDGLVVSGNEVQNVVNATNVSSTPFGGIRLLDFKNGLCFNNNIHDLSYTNASTSKIYGIAVTSSSYTTAGNPSNAQIYNNMVSRITSTGNSAVWNTTGILASAGYGDKYYYNTVHMTGQVANSSSGLVAAFANGDGNVSSVCSNIDVRNNIFSLTGTNGTSGGNFWAYYTNATTLSGSILNHNLLNCNSTGTTNNVGRFNSVNHTTLSSWQTATGQEANSFIESPVFVSNSDAHLNMGLTSTRIEQGATPIGGITTDIDGNTRPGPTGSVNGGGTIPDVGADEFDGVPATNMAYTSSTTTQVSGAAFAGSNDQNIIRIEIVTSGTLSPVSVTSFTVNANGTTNISDINATPAKIYYTGSNPVFSITGLFGSSTPTISNFNITGSQVLLTGSNYFWLVYDVVAGATNGNLIDGECQSMVVASMSQTPTVTAPAGNRIISGPMSGNYNVGVGQVFPNFVTVTEAVANLNARGVSGAVTITLLDPAYNTAESFPIVVNQITGASSSNTITLLPGVGVNTVISGAAANGALIRLNGTDFFTFEGSNNGTSSRNMTITNTSTTASSVLWLSSLGGANNGASNNAIRNCNLNTTTSTGTNSFGICIGGSTIGTGGDDNDNNLILNNVISGTNTGIYANGTADVSALGMDNLFIFDNQITISTTASPAIGIRSGNSPGCRITNNTVSVSTSASIAPVGISLETGFNTGRCNNNKIGPVTTSATGGYGGRGITIGTGSASSGITVSNNEIFGINGSNWTGFTNSSSMGICIGAVGSATILTTVAGGINIYFNSVNLSGNHSFTSATITAAIYVGSAASALDIRNNVFVNSLNNTTSSGSKNYGIYSAVANTAFTTINNNNYFGVNSTNSTFLVGFLTSDQATLTAWQTASGQEGASINLNPLFNSTNDLRPQLGSPLIGAGVGGTGVTSDRVGVSRNTIPTIGAYENAVDAANPVITYTTLSGTCSTSDRTLTATISDASGVPTTGILQPRIYYRKNSGSWVSGQGTLTSGTGINGTWDFTILSSALGGLVIGDQVQYFVIAQDLAAVPNIVSNPSVGLVATDVNTISTFPTSPNAYSIQNTLAGGTYTVGSGGNFATLTAAVAAYNTSCLGGNIVFELTQTTYSAGETFPITILPNVDASSSRKLTIRPAASVNASITGSLSSNALIRIQGNYITIDGSNNGTTTRNLSVENTSVTSPNTILIASTGTTPVTNDTIKNCNITNGINSSTAIIVGDATTIGNDGYFNNIAIINNRVQKSFHGIFIRAFAQTTNGSGLLVRDNELNAIAANAIRFTGVYVQGVNGGLITKNRIGNFEASTSESDKGIWLATGCKNINVLNNVIDSIVYTGSSGYGGHGIFVSSEVTLVNNPAQGANITIANNMISRIRGDGWNYTTIPTDNPIGIALSGTQDSIKVYHNTISLTGNTLNQTSSMSMGVYIGSGTNRVDLRNNIISNNLGLFSATGYGACGVYAVTANTQFRDINFNDYVVAPLGSGNKFIGQIAAGGSSTLSAWQTATGKDANSVNIVPVFVSVSDLHLIPCSNTSLEALGTPIAGITTDIDEDLRSLTNPDLGADEWTRCAVALNTKVFLSNVSGGTMDDYLRTLVGEFPLTDPYTAAPYSTSGLFTYVPAQTPATTTQTILDNNNVVDWVFVELRTGTSGATTVVASKSGLLKNDGIIINPDGTPLSFSGVSAGNYYIAIKHRNHCGFMTDGTIVVPNPSLLDFTNNSVTLYEPNHPALKLQGGVYAMWTGDATIDGSVDGGDVNFIRPLSGTIIDEYDQTDVNLDGGVDGGDVNLTRANSGNVGYQID